MGSHHCLPDHHLVVVSRENMNVIARILITLIIYLLEIMSHKPQVGLHNSLHKGG